MDENKKNRSIISLLRGFVQRSVGDHISAHAASTAYFFILSFIPFILFLTAILRYTPLTYKMVRETLIGFVPQSLQSFILGILAEVYGRSTAVLPLSVVTALWSSGKALQSMINGLNTIYHVKETRNWLITRLRAILFTFLFAVAVIGSLLMLVLGNRIQAVAARYVPALGRIIAGILGTRTLTVFAALFLIFMTLYKVLPNRRATFRSQIPGALFTATLWSVFSYFFSLYFEIYQNFSNMYGSLTALVLAMIWLYFCMNFVLYGAEINAYFEKEFRAAKKSVQEILNHKKDEADE